MLGIDTDKISEMVTEHTERAMQPLLDELSEIKDLLGRLVEIEEARDTPPKRGLRQATG